MNGLLLFKTASGDRVTLGYKDSQDVLRRASGEEPGSVLVDPDLTKSRLSNMGAGILSGGASGALGGALGGGAAAWGHGRSATRAGAKRGGRLGFALGAILGLSGGLAKADAEYYGERGIKVGPFGIKASLTPEAAKKYAN